MLLDHLILILRYNTNGGESMDIQEFNPSIYYAFDVWNPENNENKKHHHDFFEISIILEGEASYFFNQRWQTVRGGDILLFNPYVEHAERQLPNTHSHQLHIGIGRFELEGFSKNTFPNQEILLSSQEDQIKVFDKAWQLINEFGRQHINLICKGLIFEMMGLILRCLEQNEQTDSAILSKNDRLKQAVQLIITYIENNYAQEITIEQLATTHFVSPTYLSKIFKEVTGVSPINYLILIRLQQAYQLLVTEEYPIKEVARAVGYEDAYHFSKSFKKQYGIAPSAVRQKHSQEMAN